MNSLGTINLYTKRCLLRKFELQDSYYVFYAYASIESVAKYLTNNPHKSLYETEFMIYEFLKNYNNINYYNWIIIDQMNNKVIGTISLHEIDIYNDKAEIGIVISPYYQGKGYAKEVIQIIIEFAFYKLNIFRLEAKVMIKNDSSNSLFKKLNFNFEGVLHSSVKKNNQFFDVNLYSLLKSQYKRV